MYYEDSLEPGAMPAPRPDGVPEKFWDAATGAIRTEALLRSYLELERHMSAGPRVPADDAPAEDWAAFHRALGVPDSPEAYDITTSHELLGSDPSVNRRLHDCGFTPRQAQLVYDLAHERVLPMLREMAAQAQRTSQLDRLKEHFGGDARWTATARQLEAWGKANLAPEVFAALSASADGIKAMQRLMTADEPALGRTPQPSDEPSSEAELKKMMQDPRYWKMRDPSFIDKVSTGFRKLYGE